MNGTSLPKLELQSVKFAAKGNGNGRDRNDPAKRCAREIW